LDAEVAGDGTKAGAGISEILGVGRTHVNAVAKMFNQRVTFDRKLASVDHRIEIAATQDRPAAMPALRSNAQMAANDASIALTALSGWLSAKVWKEKHPPSLRLQKPV
jgi:hypothetical protein